MNTVYEKVPQTHGGNLRTEGLEGPVGTLGLGAGVIRSNLLKALTLQRWSSLASLDLA